ncbi:hypothetical protein D3C87_993150 [compost metagenome]
MLVDQQRRRLLHDRQHALQVGNGRRRPHHHTCAAGGQHRCQALLRMTAVQRKIGRARLEGAHDQCQQIQAAIGIQRDHLALPNALFAQRHAQPCRQAAKLGVTQPLALAARGDARTMALHLRIEQRGIAAVVGIGGRIAVAQRQQLTPVRLKQRIQPVQARVRAGDDLQQYLPESVEQPLCVIGVEQPRIVGQLQGHASAGHHHHGQRIVGVGAAALGRDGEAHRLAGQRVVHRRILEYEDAVEQAAPARDLAQGLDIHQGKVLVLADLQVLRHQGLQPRRHRRVRERQPHPQRDGVDEEPHRLLDARQFMRPTGNRHAEQHLGRLRQARQQYRPGRLRDGVDGNLLALGITLQGGDRLGREHREGIAHRRDVGRAGAALHVGQQGCRVESLQRFPPVLPGLFLVLALQPCDEVPVRPRSGQVGGRASAGRFVVGKEVAQQERTAPRIHQDVVETLHHVITIGGDTDEPHAHERGLIHWKAIHQLVAQRLSQPRFLRIGILIAPVLVGHHLRRLAPHHLQRRLLRPPDKAGTQDLVALHHPLPRLLERRHIDL